MRKAKGKRVPNLIGKGGSYGKFLRRRPKSIPTFAQKSADLRINFPPIAGSAADLVGVFGVDLPPPQDRFAHGLQAYLRDNCRYNRGSTLRPVTPLQHYYLYFIQEDKRSHKAPVKIGIAKSPTKRLLVLQTGNPTTLIIRASWGPLSHVRAIEVERKLHYRFRRMKIRGEWYSGKVLQYIKDIYI